MLWDKTRAIKRHSQNQCKEFVRWPWLSAISSWALNSSLQQNIWKGCTGIMPNLASLQAWLPKFSCYFFQLNSSKPSDQLWLKKKYQSCTVVSRCCRKSLQTPGWCLYLIYVRSYGPSNLRLGKVLPLFTRAFWGHFASFYKTRRASPNTARNWALTSLFPYALFVVSALIWFLGD